MGEVIIIIVAFIAEIYGITGIKCGKLGIR